MSLSNAITKSCLWTDFKQNEEFGWSYDWVINVFKQKQNQILEGQMFMIVEWEVNFFKDTR